MKKYFITGLVIFAPIALTIIIVTYLFDLLTTPFVGLIEGFVAAHAKAIPAQVILFLSRVIALIIVIFVIFFLGFLGRKIFFNTLLNWTHLLFLKIPFIKNVYGISKDVTKAFFSQKGKTFKKTVLLPFPHKDTYTLGFVTGDVPAPIKHLLKDIELGVFVPTAPHPFSGFILLTPKKEIQDVDITTEEAFKFLVSCGVVLPGEPVPPQDSSP